MAVKPKDKPKSNVKKTTTGKRTGLTGTTVRPGVQTFTSKPTLTAYEKEMGFKVVAQKTKTGGTVWVVNATKPGQAKYMASGGTKRPKGRKGNAPGSRPGGEAPGSDPYSPKPPSSRKQNIPGMPGWYPYP